MVTACGVAGSIRWRESKPLPSRGGMFRCRPRERRAPSPVSESEAAILCSCFAEVVRCPPPARPFFSDLADGLRREAYLVICDFLPVPEPGQRRDENKKAEILIQV